MFANCQHIPSFVKMGEERIFFIGKIGHAEGGTATEMNKSVGGVRAARLMGDHFEMDAKYTKGLVAAGYSREIAVDDAHPKLLAYASLESEHAGPRDGGPPAPRPWTFEWRESGWVRTDRLPKSREEPSPDLTSLKRKKCEVSVLAKETGIFYVRRQCGDEPNAEVWRVVDGKLEQLTFSGNALPMTLRKWFPGPNGALHLMTDERGRAQLWDLRGSDFREDRKLPSDVLLEHLDARGLLWGYGVKNRLLYLRDASGEWRQDTDTKILKVEEWGDGAPRWARTTDYDLVHRAASGQWENAVITAWNSAKVGGVHFFPDDASPWIAVSQKEKATYDIVRAGWSAPPISCEGK